MIGRAKKLGAPRGVVNGLNCPATVLSDAVQVAAPGGPVVKELNGCQSWASVKSTERLKTGAAKLSEQSYPGRAESRRRYALARPWSMF